MKKLLGKIRQFFPVRYCGAVIVAAGNASRMGGIDKVMASLGGRPMILQTVDTFHKSELIKEIVVVTREDLVDDIRVLCEEYGKVKAVIVGGNTRQRSVQAGLRALSKSVKLVAIHDGARPLITCDLIDRTVRAAHKYNAAAPAIPVKDTIKVVKSGFVVNTPDRSGLQAVQTPQIFDFDLLCAALKKVEMDCVAVTDDCAAMERMGMSVRIVEGDERNLKVTTPMDLTIAELLLEEIKCE